MQSDPPAVTLRTAFADFWSFPSPKVLLPVTVAAVGARMSLGRWKRRDLGIATAIVALEPFTEWVIHVGLLHFRPRMVAGRRIDPMVARKHRAHHADPHRGDLVFVPLPVLETALPVAVLGWWAATRASRDALTGIAASFAMLSTYEWTHYLIHSSYVPQHRPYRGIRRAHRLHHYRNERYWFGVTMHGADRMLGTFPDKDAVELSPTARDLGITGAA